MRYARLENRELSPARRTTASDGMTGCNPARKEYLKIRADRIKSRKADRIILLWKQAGKDPQKRNLLEFFTKVGELLQPDRQNRLFSSVL